MLKIGATAVIALLASTSPSPAKTLAPSSREQKPICENLANQKQKTSYISGKNLESLLLNMAIYTIYPNGMWSSEQKFEVFLPNGNWIKSLHGAMIPGKYSVDGDQLTTADYQNKDIKNRNILKVGDKFYENKIGSGNCFPIKLHLYSKR